MSPARSLLGRSLGAAVGIAAVASLAPAQVTTSSLAGRVLNASGMAVQGAQVVAVHQPSGTTYRATTRGDGRYSIPGMRVGGPYEVTVRALGFAPAARRGLSLSLGTQAEVDFALQATAVQLQAVAVTETTTGAISASRTGAATRVGAEAIQNLPTISRTIGDFTRLTPQSSGNGSFAGMDNRLNNIMVDGAFYNNAFGLGTGQPGGRANVAPIPLDAVDQIQVNIAPFDVRQGMFVGAGVNAVTKSGTNNLEGSVYYITRNEEYVGRLAGTNRVNPGTFQFGQLGARLGGPILKNRLFFFANIEDDRLAEPGTTFVPNTGSQAVEGNTTRVLEADLRRVSELAARLGHQTGPYVGYDNETPSRRYLAKLDFNANDNNKFSLRYSRLDAQADVLVSNSSSLGFGNRRTNSTAMSFLNSGYKQFEKNDSWVGEWNGQFGGRMSNQLIVGYTKNDESRGSAGSLFPTIDILRDNQTYINLGTEPFTPNNELRYSTFQIQNNFQLFLNKHELTFGGTFEKYNSENVFFPGSQSVYSYNSLDDFVRDAEGFLANPNRTTSPVTLRRFQVRYNNIPGQEKPIQPLEVFTYGAYAQDQWRPRNNLSFTLGLRMDVPRFSETAFTNPQANALTFRDAGGAPAQYRTQALPEARPLFSPRLGFNWDVRDDRRTQVRGGTGIFTGRPLYVWISNQIGQNGIITGLEELDNVTNRPFNPDPDRYKPANVTGAPASSYELNFTQPDFRFPQQWRSNVAVDQRLPYGIVATGEFIYGRDVNGMSYLNANLSAPDGRFAGPDARPRWSTDDCPQIAGTQQRVNCAITAAYVLGNQNVGSNYTISGSLEKSFANGLFAKAAYNYGRARNLIDPGSIASGTWTGNEIALDPNNPQVAFSTASPGHRAFLALSYRREYFDFGATTISLFAERRTQGNTSYTFSGDLNGDGGVNNDLIYVPRDRSEMNFEQYTAVVSGQSRTFSVQQQQDAWESYINQDDYLRSRRGQYAERGAVFLPQVFRADFSIAQDIFRPVFGKRNSLQVRLDVFNVGNMLNDDWGVGQRLILNQPLAARGADAQGRALYRLRNVGTDLLGTGSVATSYQPTALLNDVYRMQLGLRYTFQ